MKYLRTTLLLSLFGAACTGGTSGPPGPAADMASRVPRQHRAAAAACPSTRPPGPDPGSGRGTCKADSECTDAAMGQNGRCVPTRAGFVCSYDTCADDSSCGGKVCLCRDSAETAATAKTNHCLALGNCQTDRDCGGAYCSPSFGTCGNYLGVISYYCHTAKDDCVDDEDCQGTDAGPGGYCMFSPMETRWVCSYSQCAG